jgi:hypothetical protein
VALLQSLFVALLVMLTRNPYRRVSAQYWSLNRLSGPVALSEQRVFRPEFPGGTPGHFPMGLFPVLDNCAESDPTAPGALLIPDLTLLLAFD